nr:unnamed protein product [Callosobruchus chinensis]
MNKQKNAKKLRDHGERYFSPFKKKDVPARTMMHRCTSERCSKNGKQCPEIDEEQRKKLFSDYYNLADLTRQRNFLIHHVTKENVKRKTVSTKSRRTCTLRYFFTVGNNRLPVCKTFFLNTLGISERSVQTALHKTSEVGMLEKEKRGGRQRCQKVLNEEQDMRNKISDHIDRYPKMESHYCRAKTSRMYLHPDLTLQKMYDMFIEELSHQSSQRKIFNSKNLSFYNPKKDQCTLCVSFREGDEKTKLELKKVFEQHIKEKNRVRELKNCHKEAAMSDPTVLCGVFDLQQVIYLPISKESGIFYKSRLSNFNFTFYDLATNCYCFVWYEATGKRGASEIATCLFKVLERYSRQGAQKICLFSDGCYGQNKNTIVVAMLLYALKMFPQLMEISLRFFVTNHGQNEGDSAHSSISHAVMKAGDILEPSQLLPIITLARRKHPYKVYPLTFKDFLDFKTLSRKLRILSIRTAASGKSINWTDVMEVKVDSVHQNKIFFKMSHLTEEYDFIQLKRGATDTEMKVDPLYSAPVKISSKKYNDLVALCNGKRPVVRLPEMKEFYKNLPHDNV